jgi:hypothetical protein
MMRLNKAFLRASVCASLVIATGIGLLHSHAQVENRRSAMMRRKLEYSKSVLEGLTRENFTQIADGASSLKALSEASEWKMSTIPNVEQYVAYTKDFQRLCDDLSKKAEAKSIDGATLTYVQLTMNCVNCHKYVRSVTR